MVDEWKNPTGRLCLCMAEGGSRRDGEQGKGGCVFPELSKVLSLSDRISSLVLSLETRCVRDSQDALCGYLSVHPLPSRTRLLLKTHC